MNSMQTQTGMAGVLGVLAGYCAAHFQAAGLSVSDWTILLSAAGSVAAVVWPLVATRLQAAKTAVGNSGAVVITNAESAKASPSPNVVSPTEALNAPSVVAQAK